MVEWFVSFLSGYSWTIIVWLACIWVILRLAFFGIRYRYVKLRKLKVYCRLVRLTLAGSNYKSAVTRLNFYAGVTLLIMAVLVPVGLFVDKARWWWISPNPMEWGVIGDFFGGMLNPILAFASFTALLYTIRIQSEELRLTREEFAKSAEAQKELVQQAKSQRAHSLLIFTAQERLAEVTKKQLLSMEQQRVTDLSLRIMELIRTSAPTTGFTLEDFGNMQAETAAAIYMRLKVTGQIDINQPSKIMLIINYIEQSNINERDKNLLIDQLRLTLTPTGAFTLALPLASEELFSSASLWRATIKKYKLLSVACIFGTAKGYHIAWAQDMPNVMVPLSELGLDKDDFAKA